YVTRYKVTYSSELGQNVSDTLESDKIYKDGTIKFDFTKYSKNEQGLFYDSGLNWDFKINAITYDGKEMNVFHRYNK
ncbi:hypothetical protein, partial [Bacillus paralicheniformis]